MLYSNVVKRGVKDFEFINKILCEKLEGKSVVTVNISEKMYTNIFCKYGRSLSYHVDKFNIVEGLFFNNGKYAFEIGQSYNGKFGTYYKIRIIDIDMAKNENLNNRINDYNNKKYNDSDEVNKLYLEFFRIEEIENFNPFKLNFEINKTNKKIKGEFTEVKEILNKITLLED